MIKLQIAFTFVVGYESESIFRVVVSNVQENFPNGCAARGRR
ncbi:hypothetical protein BH23BAC2_BH23BAC2_06840 [soil metagenome]